MGPAHNHYRCFRCYVPDTNQEIVVDTLTFIPKKIPLPTYDINTQLQDSIDKIVTILSAIPSSNHPTSTIIKNDVQQAFKNISFLLQTKPILNKATINNKSIQTNPIWLHDKQTIRKTAQRVLLETNTQKLPRVMDSIKKLSSKNKAYNEPPSVAPTLSPMPPLQNLLNAHIKSLNITDNMAIPQSLLLNHVYDKNGKKQSLDMLLANPETKPIWASGVENELGRLAQGFEDRVQGTNTIFFVQKHEIPKDRKISYANFVCNYRPLKSEPYRVRLTVGGDKLEYPDETASPAASLIESKLIANSVISDHKAKNAKFCSLDIKDFFLSTKMERPEYTRIHRKYFSHKFLNIYKLLDKIAINGYICVKICKGMYGLKQAAILAYKQLVINLGQHGYYPIPLTTGLWKHKTRDTVFALCRIMCR